MDMLLPHLTLSKQFDDDVQFFFLFFPCIWVCLENLFWEISFFWEKHLGGVTPWGVLNFFSLDTCGMTLQCWTFGGSLAVPFSVDASKRWDDSFPWHIGSVIPLFPNSPFELIVGI